MDTIRKFISNTFKYTLYISLFFIWINYYYRNVFMSFLMAVLLSITTDKIISIFIKKRHSHMIIKSTEKKLIKDFSMAFMCSTKYQNINYFTSLFSNPITKKTKDYFIINDTTFIPYYFKSELENDDIMSIYRSHSIKTKNLVVLCTNISSSAKVLAKNIDNYNFVVLDENDVYFKFLKPLSATLPSIIRLKENKKLKFKEFISIALNRHTSRGYFTSGFIILISSLFIRYKIYYIIFASLLFVLAYISHFNVWFNKPESNDFI